MKRYKIGTNNKLRDLGGIINKDGIEVKLLRFIRSDLPTNITDNGIKFLKDNNFTTVIDLRKKDECISNPNCLKDYFDYYNINLVGNKFFKSQENFPNCYMNIINDYDNIKLVFKTIANSKGGVIYNCRAGKDRIGIISMLLLMLADVYDDDIIADYEVSYTYIRMLARKEHSKNYDVPFFVNRSEMETMEKTIELFYEKYDNIQNYLNIIGLSNEEINCIKNKLIN